MKTNPMPFLFLLLTTAALPCALAQEPAQQGAPETLRFGGGSLAEFAEALRNHEARRDGAVNIVLPEAAAQVRVPAMELTSAGVGDALQAVNTVLSPEVSLQVQRFQSDGQRTVWAVGVHQKPQSGPGLAPPEPESARRTVGVLSLSLITPSEEVSHLYTLPAATVLTAIETALQVQGDPDPELRYHQETKLLFVGGSQEQVMFAHQVLSQLQEDVTAIRNAMERDRFGQRANQQETPAEPRPDDAKTGRSKIR